MSASCKASECRVSATPSLGMPGRLRGGGQVSGWVLGACRDSLPAKEDDTAPSEREDPPPAAAVTHISKSVTAATEHNSLSGDVSCGGACLRLERPPRRVLWRLRTPAASGGTEVAGRSGMKASMQGVSSRRGGKYDPHSRSKPVMNVAK